MPAAEQAVGADRHAASWRRRERSISLCARAALHTASRGRSTAALGFNRNNEIYLMDREDKMVLTEVVLRRFEKDELT